nr:unnamed protein product [Trichobilharzia regenti]
MVTEQIPSFEDNSGPKIVPPPVPLYPLPNEDLVDIRYENTANHYWSFEQDKGISVITDRAPESNILTKSIYERLASFDEKLYRSGPINDDLRNSKKSLFIPLNGTLSDSSIRGPGIEPNKQSVYINSDGSNQSCISLLNSISSERFYFRQCLLDVTQCDYGLSLSIWLQFTTENLNPTEIILTTTPENSNGFALLINGGMLEFRLRSVSTQWTVQVPITKTLNQWTNIGVAWGKSAQNIKIVINGKRVAMKTFYQGDNYVGSNLSPTSILVGCSIDINGKRISSSVNPGMKVAAIALWYWPIQLDEIFGGGLDNYLLTSKVVAEQPVIQPQLNYADYTNEVEELIPSREISKVLNPIYQVADYYNPLLNLTTNYTRNDVKLVVDRSKLKTAYQLVEPDSCFEMDSFDKSVCPGNLTLCSQGLSIGVWIKIPTELNTSSVILDIFEFVNGLTVSVYNNYINIFINTTRGLVVFRVYNVVPKDVWFNLGVAVSDFMNPVVDVYFNGIKMPDDRVLPPTEIPLRKTDNCLQGLILGSSKISRTAAGICLSDFILWYRWLYSFESHFFVGYTRGQLENLHNASYYWTPDPYIHYDSDAQMQVRRKYNYLQPENDYSLTEIPGYSLASIFQSKHAEFPFTQTDYENKSTVPVFGMKPHQYMMLGLRKSSEVVPTNLIWIGRCLHEPSLTACNARGFSMSIWIKLLSVSQNRLRFYFNSGDGGTSSSTMNYFRGISLFTDTSLIGVSVSQFSLTWQLVLDSSSYKVGRWINIGVLWRGDVGLTLLLDGNNFGSMLPNGNKVYKPRESPPYVVLGRFNTDDQSTWLSSSDADYESKQGNGNEAQWEMSHYALGEITYFNRLLSQKEYNQQIGLLGVPHLHDITGNVWFGRYMISPPLSTIRDAVSRNISKPGAIRNSTVPDSVNLLSNPETVQLTDGGSLRLGTFQPNTCPFNLQLCERGLSIGGWYRFGGYFYKPNANQTEPIILFTGAGGNYGLVVSNNGALLGGWLQYEVVQGNNTIRDYWKCVVDGLEIGLQQKNMQWIHLSLIWGTTSTSTESNTVLQLLINGLILMQCNKNTQLAKSTNQEWIDNAIKKSQNLFYETNTHKQSFLLISSKSLIPTEKLTFSVALIVLQPKYLTLNNMMSLIGLEYFELLELRYSTFYWQMNGLLQDLTPNRIQGVNVYQGRDQYDNLKGALCTQGNELSYISFTGDTIEKNGVITNLYDSCLYDPSSCKSFAVGIRLKLIELPRQSGREQEILRTTPIGAVTKSVGLFINLSTDQSELRVEIRGQFSTSKNSVKLTSIYQPGKWINIQIFYYQDRPLTIRVDGDLLASIENGTFIGETNAKLSTQMKMQQSVIVGRGLKLCISSMTLYDTSTGYDLNSVINTPSKSTCYQKIDMFESLQGTIADYNNRENSASQLETFSKPLLTPLITCFQNPDLCSKNGILMSMWIMISGFVNQTGDNITLNNNENVTAIILSTGPPDRPGILLRITGRAQNGKLQLSLIVSIYTEGFLWLIDSVNSIKLGVWTNIAFSWYSTPEDQTGSLEVYIDGIRKHSSTIPNSALNMKVDTNVTSSVYIGSAYYKLRNSTDNATNQVLATGGITNLAYWENSKVISCSKPRRTHKFLRGDCDSNADLPETVTCILMQGCKQTDGSVCTDYTLSNIIRMASQANKLVYPSDFMKILQISTELLMKYNTTDTFSNGSSSINSSSGNDNGYAISLLFSTLRIIRAWPTAFQKLTDVMSPLINSEIAAIKLNIHSSITNLVHILLSSKFKEIWSILINDQKMSYNELLSNLNQILLYISTFNTDNQTNQCYTLLKSLDLDVASYSLNFKLNNNCSTNSSNSLALNVSYQTNYARNNWHSQFKITINPTSIRKSNSVQEQRSNTSITGGLSILTILNRDLQDNEEFMIADIPLKKFNANAQLRQVNLEAKYYTLSNSNSSVPEMNVQRVFFIASPLYSVKFFATNQSEASLSNAVSNGNYNNNLSIRIQYVIPLLKRNKYQSVYYYQTTGRKIWKAYKAERSNDELANQIRCVYWKNGEIQNGEWDTSGCQIVKANLTHVQCECNHLSLFSVAMESEEASYRNPPIWKAWGLASESEMDLVMNIIIMGGNSLSLVCSVLFLITLITVLKKTDMPDMCLTRIGLCICQIGFHATLLIEPLLNNYQITCQVIGFSMNLFSILVSSWLANETISVFKCYVSGKLKMTYCWAWTIGIFLPASLATVPTIISKASSQGGDLLCLPSRESLEFWIMFGSVFAYTIIALLTCMTLTCNIETPAFLSAYILDRLLIRVKKLNSLVLYHTITWSLFAMVIQLTVPYLVFVAFALVSLQGSWNFIIYGLRDRALYKACKGDSKSWKQGFTENVRSETSIKNQLILSKSQSKDDQFSHRGNHDKEDSKDDTQILQRNTTENKAF